MNSLTAQRAIRSVDRNRELLARGEHFLYGDEDDQCEHRALYVFHADPDAAVRSPNGVPAILFFFSSMWDSGQVSQFAPHCLHFAYRGMTAIAVDYRIRDTGGNGIIDALQDARDAWKEVINNAGPLGIDPSRVVVAGGGGGAWLAAVLGMGLREDKDVDVPVVLPVAQVFFNPLLDLRLIPSALPWFATRSAIRGLNPIKQIKKGTPSTFIAHGSKDRTLPIKVSQRFARSMKRKKNHCELIPYDGVDNSFYNLNVNERLYENSILAADSFLIGEGLLPPSDLESTLQA
ncbi:alpha/beta hydrolase [Sulfuriroseicoccus oceanibius]|uniref:Alpha/beta hydrolase fold domain-containing protein n=1 Tax=Sulfuriroseicoccus oceanibius TaxID=2707525 RepID=A0A6B3L1L8_9BACT|nr:alpha/beta hydrolase [Sulfuriroseicoccus oceanibius]QQL46254.1 alpha/beta hydrolase fold domain-containing protein [Sulfuriroseicoccus oceanibius]